MPQFQIWRTNQGKGEDKPRFSYSLRQGTEDIPVILDQNRFSRLFPKVNCDDIPEAPSTGMIEIQSRILK